MKLENISIAQVEPFRVGSPSLGSKGITRTSSNKNAEKPQSKIVLQKEKPSAEEIKKGLEAINTQLRSLNSSLQFTVDKGTDDVVVKIVDNDTGKVIRQIPSDDVLRIREHLKEKSGLIVKEKA
jgi:flagellar protein FlaG